MGRISKICPRRFELISLSLLEKFLKATRSFEIHQCCFKGWYEVMNMCYLLTSMAATQRSIFLRISNVTKILFLPQFIYKFCLSWNIRKTPRKEYTTAFSSSLENFELIIVVLCIVVELSRKVYNIIWPAWAVPLFSNRSRAVKAKGHFELGCMVNKKP